MAERKHKSDLEEYHKEEAHYQRNTINKKTAGSKNAVPCLCDSEYRKYCWAVFLFHRCNGLIKVTILSPENSLGCHGAMI